MVMEHKFQLETLHQDALALHKKMLLRDNTSKKALFGFYQRIKKIRAIMPLPFPSKNTMVKFLMKKMRKSTSMVKEPLAKKKRLTVRRYLQKLVRRRS